MEGGGWDEKTIKQQITIILFSWPSDLDVFLGPLVIRAFIPIKADYCMV